MVDNLFDAVIIGASAIGNRTAKLIAGNGHNVLLIEDSIACSF
jgi:Trk K+ transport system NAD-binding subunit